MRSVIATAINFIMLCFFGNVYGETPKIENINEKTAITYDLEIQVAGFICSSVLAAAKISNADLNKFFNENNTGYVLSILKINEELNNVENTHIKGAVNLDYMLNIWAKIQATKPNTFLREGEDLVKSDNESDVQTQAFITIDSDRAIIISKEINQRIESRAENHKKFDKLMPLFENIENIKSKKPITISIPYKDRIWEISLRPVAEDELAVKNNRYISYHIEADVSEINPGQGIEQNQEKNLRDIKIWIAQEGEFKGSIIKMKFVYHGLPLKCVEAALIINPEKSYSTKNPAP